MTVVNYSLSDTFGNNEFFWSGTTWFEQILHDEEFHASLRRQLIFTGLILLIEIPLGLAIALDIARAHGGDLRLDDSPKGGLRAIIEIPV